LAAVKLFPLDVGRPCARGWLLKSTAAYARLRRGRCKSGAKVLNYNENAKKSFVFIYTNYFFDRINKIYGIVNFYVNLVNPVKKVRASMAFLTPRSPLPTPQNYLQTIAQRKAQSLAIIGESFKFID